MHFTALLILSWTTRVSWYLKKHSPTLTYGQSSLICLLHLLWSMASSLFNLRAWQSERCLPNLRSPAAFQITTVDTILKLTHTLSTAVWLTVQWFITSPSGGLWNIVISLCVCLSVHSHNSKITRPSFTNFWCVLPVAVARHAFDGVAIRYVLWFYGWRHVFIPWDGRAQRCVLARRWVGRPANSRRLLSMIVMTSLSVCLSLCLSAHITLKLKTARSNFTKFFVHVACGRARSFSDGVAINYILPVLWMT